MAKGRKSTHGTRDDRSSLTVTLRSRPSLKLYQDLRAFDAEPATSPARLFSGVTAQIGPVHGPSKPKKGTRKVPYQIAFQAPKQTLVCVRRQRRKEVLFAKRKTGQGGQRRARWSKFSGVKC